MKEIDQKLDQWIHNSIIRAEIRKVIEDYILDQKAEAFKAGWIKGVFQQPEKPITNSIRSPKDNINTLKQ